MPPLALSQMNEAQRKAAEEMTAGPRKGVKTRKSSTNFATNYFAQKEYLKRPIGAP